MSVTIAAITVLTRRIVMTLEIVISSQFQKIKTNANGMPNINNPKKAKKVK